MNKEFRERIKNINKRRKKAEADGYHTVMCSSVGLPIRGLR